MLIQIQRAGQPAGGLPHPTCHLCASPGVSARCAEMQDAPASALPRPLSAGLRGPSIRLCEGWLGFLAALPLASRPFKPVFMSLSVLHAGPGARPHSLNYHLHRTQCSLLKARAGRRESHFHGKGSELNPLLILSETPCQADTVR